MKKIIPYCISGLIFGLIMTISKTCSDGLGISKVSNYYSKYGGDVSYKYYKITFRPEGYSTVKDLSFPILYYGFDLTNNVILKAKILQSEIPLKDLHKVFYDTVRLGKLSSDSVYFGWIGIRGNYLTFPFSNNFGFKLTDYSAFVMDDAAVTQYPTLTEWKKPILIYAWASLLMPFTFAIAFFVILFMPSFTKSELLYPILFVLLHLIPASYVGYFDYVNDEFPYLIVICTGVLLVLYFVFLGITFKNKFKSNTE